MSEKSPEVSIVMPCLNEAESLGACIRKAQEAIRKNNLRGEVVVADNGSQDGSPEIARSLGARVVQAPVRGYGAALMAGFSRLTSAASLLELDHRARWAKQHLREDRREETREQGECAEAACAQSILISAIPLTT